MRYILTAVYVSLFLASGCTTEPKSDREPINILAWVGYDEPELVGALEQKIGKPVRVKTYVGGDQMYNMLTTAAPGTYDVVVVDVEYGRKLSQENRLTPLKSADLLPSGYHHYFKDFAPASVQSKDGDAFGIVIRWGALGLVYNTNQVERSRMTTYESLWDPQYRGKVGLFDWYLPNMGIISKSLGNRNAYTLDSSGFAALESRTLQLAPQVASINVNTSEVIADLDAGNTWLVPGIGEWACAGLILQGKPLDWAIPKEGGIMWIEALAIPAELEEGRKGRALSFVKAMTEPDVQALLAWRQAYQSQVPNLEAYERMTPLQRTALKISSASDVTALTNRLSVRELPRNQTEREWQAVWDKLKSTTLGN